MKRVISVSLGSSKRNHKVNEVILGEEFQIERIGTDGSLIKAASLIEEYDGHIDAFGLGGADIYISAGARRYVLRETSKLAKAAKKTPIVDGSGLKNTLERKTVEYLVTSENMEFKNKRVFMVCAMDRFGMAESFEAQGADTVYGDLMFGLGIPIPLYSLRTLDRLARIIAPLVCQLPFKYLYPTGKKQEGQSKQRYERYYRQADVIAGDFHYIKRYLPSKLPGKIIITNTITSDDVNMLADIGIETLITTTPNLGGRSFGTNVLEAILVALTDKKPEDITSTDYDDLLDKLKFKPWIKRVQEKKEAGV